MAEADFTSRWARIVAVALASDDPSERLRGIEVIFAHIEAVRRDVQDLRADIRRWLVGE